MDTPTDSSLSYVRWFEEIGIEDVPIVGGKNASLGEMYRELAPKGVNVPNGFAITAQAYRDFLSEAGLEATIGETLKGLDTQDLADLSRRGNCIRQAMIAAAFYPKDVIVRLSDFKSNEYANLIGGRRYEPIEENPMLGFRGASRYYDARYRAGFALECRALRYVREDMGLTNVKVMIPFCRTVEEGRRVLDEMARHGLRRGERGLQVYLMCEIPSNVLLAEEFAAICDGFSIGSNDLTQLTLGVDRDSELVAPLFDERNPAVMRIIAMAIQGAKRAGRKIGICGQAPSDYPEFARFLVEQGIDSLSLNPDAVIRTTVAVLDLERTLSAERGEER